MYKYGRWGHHAYGCCQPEGHGRHHFHRRFVSREEKISRMEEYLSELKAETKAVEEHLEDLRKTR